MLKTVLTTVTAATSLIVVGMMGSNAVLASGEAANSVWELMEPACNANGIDPGPCRCIMNAVIERHGVEAATVVALEMQLRDDEAAALKEQIGEDQAMNASIYFDEVQNGACANAPPPADGGGGTASSSMEGAASATDAAQ